MRSDGRSQAAHVLTQTYDDNLMSTPPKRLPATGHVIEITALPNHCY